MEVVSITTPNALHAPMAIAALEAGKHVWCEKPMAPSLKDSKRMAAVARASGCVAILGDNYIQSPAVRFIGKLLKSDAIGLLTHFRLEMDEDSWPIPRRRFHGGARRGPATAPWTISPSTR